MYSGGCRCGEVRYRLLNAPLFVHACHCVDCQKASGSAFGITIIVLETDVTCDKGEFVSKPVAANRTTFVCHSCEYVIYSTATHHPCTALLRSQTLDDPRVLEINAHIWIAGKSTPGSNCRPTFLSLIRGMTGLRHGLKTAWIG